MRGKIVNHIQKLIIQWVEPWTWEGLEPPEDPLSEFSHLELGLRSFCFECNHKLLLTSEDKKQVLYLDPDIILILHELPEIISQLLSNQAVELSFPESWMILELQPLDSMKMNCIWRKYGSYVEKYTFEVERFQVIDVLRQLVIKVVNQAVGQGYITDDEKDDFLQEIVTQVNC
jgi:hypothetical protein